jgi:ParB family chromosome partitioning protein
VSSSKRGLPDYRKMRHDRHFVEELANHSVTNVGLMVEVASIETNREQPRSNLGDLSELTASIRARGVLEPLIVRRASHGRGYQLIAGERRLHAAVEAGLSEVPCIEVTANDQEALELALVENLQRKDLTPFEEAEGYHTLVQRYAYTHEQVATAVGKSRTSVTETLKLLDIPPAIRDLCRHADITAKSMLLLIARAGSIQEMESLVQLIAENSLDRAAARAAAHAAHGAPDTPGSQSETEAGDSGRTGFKPVHLSLRTEPQSPVRLSVSIRRPGVSLEELIRSLEEILARLRRGDLDEELRAAAAPADH